VRVMGDILPETRIMIPEDRIRLAATGIEIETGLVSAEEEVVRVIIAENLVIFRENVPMDRVAEEEGEEEEVAAAEEEIEERRAPEEEEVAEIRVIIAENLAIFRENVPMDRAAEAAAKVETEVEVETEVLEAEGAEEEVAEEVVPVTIADNLVIFRENVPKDPVAEIVAEDIISFDWL